MKTYSSNPQNLQTYLNENTYQKLYQQSIQEPQKFWAEMAEQTLFWHKKWDTVLRGNLAEGNVKWFAGAELNASYNCIDRHLEKHANDVAIIWEGDHSNSSKKITYRELHQETCRFANVLKKYGVKKGDRVCIYMPMIPAAIYAMLACARVGAIHMVVFSGFSAQALSDRLNNARCEFLITADGALRGGKTMSLKINVDEALQHSPQVKTVLVIRHLNNEIAWQVDRDVDYEKIKLHVSDKCAPELIAATDPLFILYTSGSTGKPKGIIHGTGGYLVYAALTHRYVFNYHPGDIYWCTADIGWITGHTYGVYGALANAATMVLFEGVPTYPTPSRIWEIVDKYHVNILYTAPTLIRMLMREGDQFVKNSQRKSLKILGSVGEPINPAAWEWYNDVVGEQHSPIVDTWWQTETGGVMITPLPGIGKLKPGAALRPFFGVAPKLVDDDGKIIEGEGKGNLIITQAWPGMLQDVYGDHQRFLEAYLQQAPGNYFTGDCAMRDSDGDYWIIGRIDDVLNVAGHRLSTAEVESALVSHEAVAEAAVVGVADEIKGEGIYAFVTLKEGINESAELQQQVKLRVREKIGSIATPDIIQWAAALPKTRSGKILRRLLRKIANNEIDNLGDTSTLADESVVATLIAGRIKK